MGKVLYVVHVPIIDFNYSLRQITLWSTFIKVISTSNVAKYLIEYTLLWTLAMQLDKVLYAVHVTEDFKHQVRQSTLQSTYYYGL